MTTCWDCNSPVKLHKDRVEKKHPFPDNSFWCEKCKTAVLLCDGCGDTRCEWFYDLNELWEDIEVVGGKVYCPGCWQNDAKVISEMEKEEKERGEKMESFLFSKLVMNTMFRDVAQGACTLQKKRKVEENEERRCRKGGSG